MAGWQLVGYPVNSDAADQRTIIRNLRGRVYTELVRNMCLADREAAYTSLRRPIWGPALTAVYRMLSRDEEAAEESRSWLTL